MFASLTMGAASQLLPNDLGPRESPREGRACPFDSVRLARPGNGPAVMALKCPSVVHTLDLITEIKPFP